MNVHSIYKSLMGWHYVFFCHYKLKIPVVPRFSCCISVQLFFLHFQNSLQLIQMIFPNGWTAVTLFSMHDLVQVQYNLCDEVLRYRILTICMKLAFPKFSRFSSMMNTVHSRSIFTYQH